MRALLFDYPGSSLNRIAYAYCMRMAYLLANKVVYAGDAAEIYHIIQHRQSLTNIQMVQVLQQYMPREAELVKLMKDNFKASSKIRFKDAPLLAMHKKAQAQLSAYFKLAVDDLASDFYANRFLPAADVYGHPQVFQRLLINNNPERSEKYVPAYSEWLLLHMEEEEERDIVMLSEEFLQHFDLALLNTNCSAGQMMEREGVYLCHCITLVDPGPASMYELEHIRNFASTGLTPFRQVMNQWIDLFVENEEGINTRSFFNEQVLPCATQLEATWQQCHLLGHISKRRITPSQVNVWMGEVPVQMIWQFYKDKSVIPEATWNRLQQAAADDDRLAGTWPVIVVRPSATVDDDSETIMANEDGELPARKTIRL